MQNQIQTFSFNNEALQVINKDGNAWFVASEIAALFGYRDAANLTRLLDDDEADTHIMSIRSENGVTQNRTVSIINESGFYHAAFKSRKPEVKPFRKWVTNEVLPTIRKTGSYSLSNPPASAPRINEEQYARLVALCVAWSNANPDNDGMTRSHTGITKALREMERAVGKSLSDFDTGDYAAAVDCMADKILAFRHINARHPFQKMSKGDLAQTLAAITELLPALPPADTVSMSRKLANKAADAVWYLHEFATHADTVLDAVSDFAGRNDWHMAKKHLSMLADLTRNVLNTDAADIHCELTDCLL